MLRTSDRIFCALDTTDTTLAVDLAKKLRGVVGGMKVGLEFYCANGAEGFKAIAKTGMPIFLDLKFHDIPNTVAGAIRAVAPLAPKILTIHTQGGPDMMRRAAETAAEEAEKNGVKKPWVTGVTILTSLDDADMAAIGVGTPVGPQVEQLATLAAQNGLDGIVCSPVEIKLARRATKALNPHFKLVVPGIRPAGTAIGDQKRVMTPREAVLAGADILVIGRPITKSGDPRAAAESIAESING